MSFNLLDYMTTQDAFLFAWLPAVLIPLLAIPVFGFIKYILDDNARVAMKEHFVCGIDLSFASLVLCLNTLIGTQRKISNYVPANEQTAPLAQLAAFSVTIVIVALICIGLWFYSIATQKYFNRANRLMSWEDWWMVNSGGIAAMALATLMLGAFWRFI